MQPPTTPTPAMRGDEAELYQRHHRDLQRAVARVVNAPRELIEDACQNAWAIMLCAQPSRTAIFAWLRVVATREAYRLSVIARREARLGSLRPTDGGVGGTVDDPHVLDDALEVREALRVLAALPVRQRTDLSLKIAGYSYEEIRTLTGGRTYTNVNKSLVKARAGIRRARTPGQ